MLFPNASRILTANSAVFLGLTITCYWIVVIIYRLFFHPLAKFPGSKLVAATRLYEFHYDSTKHGRFWKKLEEMHERYGPIVRINPHEIHINDPEFYDKLFNFDHDLDKDPLITREIGMTRNVQATNEWALHRRRRAPFNNFFSRKQILSLEGLIHEYAEKMCDAIRDAKEKDDLVYLSLLYRMFTAEIVCVYCFGKSYGFFEDLTKAETLLINSARPGDVPGYAYHLGRFTNYLSVFIFFQNIFQVTKTKLGFVIENSAMEFIGFASRLVREVLSGESAEKAASTPDRPTIFHKIVGSTDIPAEEKTVDSLIENALLFLSAGYETTGYTLTLATYHVFQNSTLKARMKVELADIWSDIDTLPPLIELEKLPLLSAVIKEALRLGTGVLSRLSRIKHHETIQFKQWEIPAGTPVSMSQPLIHYNAELFPDPLKFDPDRWLQGEKSTRLEKYLVPFSRGSRGCIGAPLAMAELQIALATVLRRFDGKVCNTTPQDIESYHDDFVPSPKNGKQRLFVRMD